MSAILTFNFHRWSNWFRKIVLNDGLWSRSRNYPTNLLSSIRSHSRKTGNRSNCTLHSRSLVHGSKFIIYISRKNITIIHSEPLQLLLLFIRFTMNVFVTY
jgi:hypothetical protein